MEKIICPHCKEPIYSGPANCPICKKPLTGVQVQSKQIPQTYQQPTPKVMNNLVEYRRTCQVCGKVWHSLVSREEQIISTQKTDAVMAASGALQSCGTCGTMGTETQAQARGNLSVHENELQRLRSCPQCSSVNYKEEIIDHANQLRQ